MSSNAVVRGAMQKATPGLPSEVWSMIFEQIWLEAWSSDVAHRLRNVLETTDWLGKLRLLSSGFDHAIKPWFFEIVDWSYPRALHELGHIYGDDLVHDKQLDRFKKHVKQYTQSFRIGSNFTQAQSQGLAEIISSSSQLEELHWATESPPNDSSLSTMSVYLNAFFHGYDNMDIHMRMGKTIFMRMDLPRTFSSRGERRRYIGENGADLKSSHIDPYISKRLQKRLIISSAHTPAIYFYNNPAFVFRFPAASKISLLFYEWKDSSTTGYLARFDFSILRTLSLCFVDLEQFLAAVPSEHLENLERLKISTDYPGGDIPTYAMGALLQRLTKLVKLHFDGPWECFLLPLDICGLHLLQKLCLTSSYDDRWSLEPFELEEIRDRCPSLRVLQIDDIDEYDEDHADKFLNAITSFPNLQVFTLTGLYFLNMSPVDPQSLDPDYDCAGDIFERLAKGKCGKRLETLEVIIKFCHWPLPWYDQYGARGINYTESTSHRTLGAYYFSPDDDVSWRCGSARREWIRAYADDVEMIDSGEPEGLA